MYYVLAKWLSQCLFFFYFLKIECQQLTFNIMNIKWDYNYYQPWSDNEWLVDGNAR